MKRPQCPRCGLEDRPGTNFKLVGKFYRRSDSTFVPRYKCNDCGKGFSSATYQPCYRQKKRHKNLMVRRLLCSGVSQRRCAKILNLDRKTVVAKFLFLAIDAEFFVRKFNFQRAKAHTIEFDDLETIEHSKMKPLSVTLAVESGTRRILGIEVSRMPAKGLLAKKSREKYGPRIDERKEGRERLFRSLKWVVTEHVALKSDENPLLRAGREATLSGISSSSP